MTRRSAVFLRKIMIITAFCTRLVSRQTIKSFRNSSQHHKTLQRIGTVGWDLCHSLPSHRASTSSTDCGARAAHLSAASGRRTTRLWSSCPFSSSIEARSSTSSTTLRDFRDPRLSSWLIFRSVRAPRSCLNWQRHFEAPLIRSPSSADTSSRH